MEGSIRVTRQNDRHIITLRGQLDQDQAFSMMRTAHQLPPPVVFDFRQVKHISVAGSFALLSCYQTHKQKPTIQGANPDIISFLKLSGTARYVNFSPNTGTNATNSQDKS